MATTLDDLRRRMDQAAADMDFEEAQRLRDQISLLRGQPDADADQAIDTSRLRRHEPGKMGLGTSEQRMSPPPGWKPPKKPDPMTTSTKAPKHRRR